MSVTLISVSHDTVVSNKHEEQTRHYYVNFQHNPYIITFNRIAGVASFAGLWGFPQGCNFKQWTGNDSKALMKASDTALPWICTSNMFRIGLSTSY